MAIPSASLTLSGDRFSVVYALTAKDEGEALEKAEAICLEQTVEFPRDLLPVGDIADRIVGRVEVFKPLTEGRFEVVISYAVETTGFELTQLLNVVFGNSSLKPGIRVERLSLPDSLLRAFKGPRFGREGLRARVQAGSRPLLCTALKPMGLSPKDLAEQAYRCALGGIDIIKDDHGLADQPFAPYRQRVELCAEAVERANRTAGMHCIYVPNVTGPAPDVMDMARFAKSAGVGGLVFSPGLGGFSLMQQLAGDDHLGLPVLAHPAFLGSFVTSSESGISHYVLFGQITRLAGADATIYPNFGGRFSFSREECASIAGGTTAPMGNVKPIFPAPGGGMSLTRVPELFELYGSDVIFLIGAGLHRHGPDLTRNSTYFREMVEQMKSSANGQK